MEVFTYQKGLLLNNLDKITVNQSFKQITLQFFLHLNRMKKIQLIVYKNTEVVNNPLVHNTIFAL